MKGSTLHFLADESCDFAVVRALGAAGYDVLTVSEVMPGAEDREVIDLAAREQRILLTEDKDFGWLVFASHVQSAGVVLIRFPSYARADLARAIEQLVRESAERLAGAFCVLQPGQARISRRPDPPR